MSQVQPYTGPERRVAQRRKSPDRRDMMRFEPTKNPRRLLKDRRVYSQWDGRNGF